MAPERKTADELLREQIANAERSKEFAMGLFGASMGLPAALVPTIFKSSGYNFSGDKAINLAENASKYFAGVDPRLKSIFLRETRQPYENKFLTKAGEVIDKMYPFTEGEYRPADLSTAGKFNESLNKLTGDISSYPDLIMTVTPGPNPARFANPEILDIDPQRGYLWGNTQAPQFSYAEGNTSQNVNLPKPTDISNPTIHFVQADLKPETKGAYYQTTDVQADPTLSKNRIWGTRSGDVMFPKETVISRGVVTANDLAEAIRREGTTPTPRRINAKPGDYLSDLAAQYSDITKKPVNAALLDLASPAPSLGSVGRDLGSTQIKMPFDVAKLTPDEKIKAGIDTVFVPSKTEGYRPDTLKIAGTNTGLVVSENLRNPPQSGLASRFAGSNRFLRPGIVGAVGAISPDVIEDLYEGRPGTAVYKAGASVATGAATDALLRAAAVKAAEAGYLAPVRALTSLSNLAGPVGLALSLGGDTPQPQVVGTYKGAPVYRNPQGAFIAEPSGESPVRLGKAVRGGKTVYVPWGSVAGSGPVQTGTYQGAPVMRSPTGVLTTQTTPTSTPQRLGTAIRGGKQVYVPWGSVAGRPWWDVGQYFGR